MNAEQYLYETNAGHTVIHGPCGHYTFLGTSVESLAMHMQDAAKAIERHHRRLRMLHAVVQDMRPEAVTFQSIHTAKRL